MRALVSYVNQTVKFLKSSLHLILSNTIQLVLKVIKCSIRLDPYLSEKRTNKITNLVSVGKENQRVIGQKRSEAHDFL